MQIYHHHLRFFFSFLSIKENTRERSKKGHESLKRQNMLRHSDILEKCQEGKGRGERRRRRRSEGENQRQEEAGNPLTRFLRTWLVPSVTRVGLRLVAIRHIPDTFHGTTMIRAEAVKGAGIRFRVIGPRIPRWLHLAVRVIVARLPENAQLWNAEHRVPAHVITHRGAPLKSF